MNKITLLKMLDTCCYDSILKLKIALIRNKNMGLVFYKETISGLELDQPFEFYYHATKGTITYQNAFPLPVRYYKHWMTKNSRVERLIPYFQTYYETFQLPEPKSFKALSLFKGEKYVWFYKVGDADA